MPHLTAPIIIPATHQNCARVAARQVRAASTFIPNIPVSTVSGRKMVEITVSTFITVVQLIRDRRQVRVEDAGDPVLEEHRLV